MRSAIEGCCVYLLLDALYYTFIKRRRYPLDLEYEMLQRRLQEPQPHYVPLFESLMLQALNVFFLVTKPYRSFSRERKSSHLLLNSFGAIQAYSITFNIGKCYRVTSYRYLFINVPHRK